MQLFSAAFLATPSLSAASTLQIPLGENISDRQHDGVATVSLGSNNITGFASAGIETFNGIPYADAPVGKLRLRPPQQLLSALGDLDASGSPRYCPQMPLFADEGPKYPQSAGLFPETAFMDTNTGSVSEDKLAAA